MVDDNRFAANQKPTEWNHCVRLIHGWWSKFRSKPNINGTKSLRSIDSWLMIIASLQTKNQWNEIIAVDWFMADGNRFTANRKSTEWSHYVPLIHGWQIYDFERNQLSTIPFDLFTSFHLKVSCYEKTFFFNKIICFLNCLLKSKIWL